MRGLRLQLHLLLVWVLLRYKGMQLSVVLEVERIGVGDVEAGAVAGGEGVQQGVDVCQTCRVADVVFTI